jgi:hypothetical protein
MNFKLLIRSISRKLQLFQPRRKRSSETTREITFQFDAFIAFTKPQKKILIDFDFYAGLLVLLKVMEVLL